MRRDESPWWKAGFTREWWLGDPDHKPPLPPLPLEQRVEFLDDLSDDELEDFFKDWRVWARDNQLLPEGRWTKCLCLCGRGWGKALALDTPIATPTGWTTMGEVRTGDTVFDDAGRPTRVVKAHDVLHDRECFRVSFSDGSEIVADGEHLWATETGLDRKAAGRGNPRQMGVRTTAEIRATLSRPGRRTRDRNHSIPACGVLDLPAAALPIDPYLLGVWLGDGTSAAGEITSADPEIIQAFRDAGEPVGKVRAAGGRSSTYAISRGAPGSLARRAATFGGRLRALGVLRNKHIPAVYLRASADQRLALLQGLMDTDGYAEASKAEFCSSSTRLADDVFELVASLGMIPRLGVGRASIDGRDCGPKYRVSFRPHTAVFRLERKLTALRPTGAQACRTKRRFITAVEPVESVPVRCITVASASSLYLAGRGMISTHNTRVGSEYCTDQAKAGRWGRIAIVGQGESDIREVMIEGDSGFLATAHSDFRPIWQPSVGTGRLVWPNGAVGYLYSAEDPEALRGPQFDGAWVDEPMAFPAEKRQRALSNLRFGMRRGKHPRTIFTTTPKPHRWLTEELASAAKYEHLPVEQRRYIVVKGNTYENRDNLPEVFFEGLIEDYEGTNLGRQEIYAEILGSEAGALWTADILDKSRVADVPTDPGQRIEYLRAFAQTCERVIVSIDPNTSSTSKTAHEAGIAVLGKRGGLRYVIDDWSIGGGPAKWAARGIAAYLEFDADEIVAEVNQGGDMVKSTIQGEANEQGIDVRVHMVRATRGKQRRAEPIAAAYDRGIVKHLGGVGSTLKPGPFFKLESQMCALHDAHDPTGEDFDRCDAVVWGLTRLGVKRVPKSGSGQVQMRTFAEMVG